MSRYSKFQIDYSSGFDEGGYSQFYLIKDNPFLGFKEFRSKKHAQQSYSIQKKLSKFDLAPKIVGNITRLEFMDTECDYELDPSEWGYVTEMARVGKPKFVSLKRVQDLVDEILLKTGLKFWDCHWYNMGLIKRNGKNRLVCIDTGKESFSGVANAWGYGKPGPKCDYCEEYDCKCSEGYYSET